MRILVSSRAVRENSAGRNIFRRSAIARSKTFWLIRRSKFPTPARSRAKTGSNRSRRCRFVLPDRTCRRFQSSSPTKYIRDAYRAAAPYFQRRSEIRRSRNGSRSGFARREFSEICRGILLYRARVAFRRNFATLAATGSRAAIHKHRCRIAPLARTFAAVWKWKSAATILRACGRARGGASSLKRETSNFSIAPGRPSSSRRLFRQRIK